MSEHVCPSCVHETNKTEWYYRKNWSLVQLQVKNVTLNFLASYMVWSNVYLYKAVSNASNI